MTADELTEEERAAEIAKARRERDEAAGRCRTQMARKSRTAQRVKASNSGFPAASVSKRPAQAV